MASFSDLSNELVLEIINHVLPDDLESFTSTCKTIWIMAKEKLRIHRHLKQRYSRLRCSYGSDSLSDILDDVIVDYRTVFYIKELTVDLWYSAWHDPEDSDMEDWDTKDLHLPYPEHQMVRMRQAASELVPQAHSREWIQEIEKGDQGPVFGLLLLLLPNLSTLRIKRFGYTDERLFETLERVAAMRGTELPLSKLKKIELLHADRYEFEDLYPVIQFAALPSVNSISGRIHCFGQSNGVYQSLPPRSSNVEELVFISSSITPEIIFDFLEGFKALRIFTYHSGHLDDENAGRGTVDPFWIRAALLAHARTSLESLTLCSHTMKRRYMGNIRSFENLNTLVTDLQMLLHEGQLDDRASLADALPAKLETLKLHYFEHGGEDKIPALILKLVEMKIRRVPRLRELKVVTRKGIGNFLRPFIEMDKVHLAHNAKPVRTTQQSSYFETLHTKCRKVGIELRFKRMPFRKFRASHVSHHPKWCICQEMARGSMVKCANDACSHGEKFHLDCVGISAAVPESWLCPECALEEQQRHSRNDSEDAADGPKSIIASDQAGEHTQDRTQSKPILTPPAEDVPRFEC